MYFVYRDGTYINAAGQSFRDFLSGRLPALPGEKPTLKDWEDHLTTAFPEVRLKRYLEMRGADGGPWAWLCALPAFWVGLLYHQPSLDAAWDLAKDWTLEERMRLRVEVPRLGLRTQVRGRTVREIALELIALAGEGLTARARLNASGDNESGFLDPLREVLAAGRTPAERLLERYHGDWGGDISRIYEEESF
jgi:glutamate--cysteine ligase